MNDLYIQGVHIDWNKIPVNSYLREIDAIKGLEELIFHNSITFFVGENGSGKSTLLEALAVACGFNPEGGTKNYIFSTYDSHSQLHEAIRVVKGYRQAKWGYFLRAESFYNVATKEEEYADWEHPSEKYHEKSHGESFLALAQNYLKPNADDFNHTFFLSIVEPTPRNFISGMRSCYASMQSAQKAASASGRLTFASIAP